MKRPHLLYLHSHDTGRWVAPWGYPVPTPHIQRLAGEGVLFRQAFCANPTCSPSRASLLTGQWAHSCGMGGLVNRGWSLPRPERLLPRVLAAAGYRTVRAGLQHVVADPAEGGYERILEGGVPVEERAAAFLAEPHDRPFFLDVGFTATHRRGKGFDPPPEGEEPTDPGSVQAPAPLPEDPEIRRDMASFIDAARTLDRQMGRVLAALDANGLSGETLVICTTDHGPAFPRMKCNLTDQGLGVMLILRGPGGLEGGRAIDGLVSQIDLFPTVCDLAGLGRPDWLQGVSLLPLVEGRPQVREELFAEINYHVCHEPQRAVRTRRWKYIRRLHPRARPVLPNCDDSPSKDFLLAQGWGESEEAAERLYDLAADPLERDNLAAEASRREVLAEMRGRLQRWQRETGDPLLDRPFLEPPDTAVVADPEDLSPRTASTFPAREFLEAQRDA